MCQEPCDSTHGVGVICHQMLPNCLQFLICNPKDVRKPPLPSDFHSAAAHELRPSKCCLLMKLRHRVAPGKALKFTATPESRHTIHPSVPPTPPTLTPTCLKHSYISHVLRLSLVHTHKHTRYISQQVALICSYTVIFLDFSNPISSLINTSKINEETQNLPLMPQFIATVTLKLGHMHSNI